MGGLGGKNGRAAAVKVFDIAVHGIAVAVHRIKTGITVPGLVEMKTVNTLPQQFFYPFDVVAQTVISGVGDNGMDGRRIYPVTDQRIVAYRFGYGLSGKISRQNRADNAVLIAGRHKIGRNCAGHGNGMFYRLVAIAVTQGNLIAGNAGQQNDTV